MKEANLSLAEHLSMAQQAYDAVPKEIRVTPSVPILYFGDLQKFTESPTRIITVGLNPSDAEFPEGDPFQRFPAAKQNNIKQALDDYFRITPYSNWFDSIEPLLSGFDASYYGTAQNTALHTDILSPIATKPTWSRLTKEERESLCGHGPNLWHNLVKSLNPDIILASVAKAHLNRIEFDGINGLKNIFSFPGKINIPFQHTTLSINNKKVDFIFARAAQKPFGFFKNSEKESLGKALKKSGKMNNW